MSFDPWVTDLRLLVVALVTLLGAGCARAPLNVAKKSGSETNGYYFSRFVPIRVNNGETLFLVAFSGGGTRAAAMSYGVLEELRRTAVPGAQPPRALIDDISVISSVSGGSFTAAAYALYGDQLFPSFETNFLKRDVQGKLVGKTFSPWNWPALGSPWYGRSDMAAEYYDRILFHGATFADLRQAQSPFVLINATEVSTGIQFWFTQDLFDNLCSDVSRFPLSRAVAASSAVPVALSPITLQNFAGTCDYVPPPWMQTRSSRSDGIPDTGENALGGRAREMARLRNRETRPYLHLVDGGVADNLGLRPLLEGLATLESNADFRQGLRFETLKRVVLLSVNARSSPENDWDQHQSPPGMMSLALAAPSITMDRYSRDTVDLMGALVRQMEGAVREQAGGRIKFFPIVLSFDNLPDPQERRYFLNVPTSFFLSNESVDRLREVGGRLLRNSPNFRALLKDFSPDEQGSSPRP
jgi:NTE family protein